jgi:cell division protein FtsB
MALQQLGLGIRSFLNNPRRVAIICILFVSLSALFNGVLWRLWALHRDHDKRLSEMASTQDSIRQLKHQVEQAKDPIFIERQARDRLDLAGEKDLVFVFPTQ